MLTSLSMSCITTHTAVLEYRFFPVTTHTAVLRYRFFPVTTHTRCPRIPVLSSPFQPECESSDCGLTSKSSLPVVQKPASLLHAEYRTIQTLASIRPRIAARCGVLKIHGLHVLVCVCVYARFEHVRFHRRRNGEDIGAPCPL